MAEEKRGLGTLLQESFSVFTDNITRLVVVTLIAYLPVGIAFSCYLVYLKGQSWQGLVGSFILLIAITAILFLLYPVALIRMIQSINAQEELTPLASYQKAWGVIASYLWIGTIVLFKVILWSLLFIIPGIIFGIFYSFWYLAFLIDNKRGNEALIYSKKIIKPNFWPYVGYSLVLVFIMVVVYLLIGFVVKLLFGVPVRGSFSLMPTIGSFFRSILEGIVSIYATIFCYKLYKELKSRLGIEIE